jgi:hypothetical protein
MQSYRHVVLCDSADRSFDAYPTPNTYQLRLPNTYKNVIGVRLLSAEIPASFYVFTAALGNTTITIGTTAVTIPDGNYTPATLATAVETAARAAGFTGMTVTLNATTNKITFVYDNAFTVSAAAGASSATTQWGLAFFLGFNKVAVASTYVNAAVGSGPQQVRAPRIVNTVPHRYLVMDVNEINQVDTTGESGNRAFAKMPLSKSETPFSVGYLDQKACISNPSTLKAPIATLDRLTIVWKYHDGKLVDFNSVDHSFTIEIECSDNQFSTTSKVIGNHQQHGGV